MIQFPKHTEKILLGSIKQFVLETFDEDIGDLKAAQMLEFFVKEIGPSVYNQAIADAQAYVQEKAADLGEARYEPEFGYWQKKP